MNKRLFSTAFTRKVSTLSSLLHLLITINYRLQTY